MTSARLVGGPPPLSVAAIGVLRSLVRPFAAEVFCHAPADRPFDLAEIDRPDDEHDRWSAAGTRTAYLAGDPFVALAEYARHAEGQPRADERRIMRLSLSNVGALDLREPKALAAIGASDAGAFIGRGFARAVGSAVRSAQICQALIVPSMAFVDRVDRRNIVVFCEAVPGGLTAVLREPTEIGRIVIGR